MSTATGTATDSLSSTATDTLTITTGGATGIRTLKSSFFANRVNWGNSITETVQGPEAIADPYYHLAGPYTLGFRVQAVIDCTSTGMRVMKMPAGAGAITALCWNSAGTEQARTTATWVADDGGWYEFTWPSPVSLTAGADYYFGYHYPGTNTNYALSTYVWNNGQDTCVYPLLVTTNPTFYKAGGSPTWTGTSSDYNPHNVYVDPVMTWNVDVPGYTAGTDYYDQFPNGGPTVPFPLVIDWADAPYVDDYAALGMNSLMVGGGNEGYFDQIKTTGLDFYPSLHAGDLSGIQGLLDDSALAAHVRGYFLTDEPENSSSTPPATLRTWRNSARRLDSTRPIYLNLGRNIIENQGFSWQPTGISAKDVNLQYREYMSLVDFGSMDGYGIAHTYPYTYQGGSDTHRYGIWIYPLQIHRMRTEITDGRIPIWGEVETTSAYPSSPTPDQVKKAVWSMLIAGAKGILYFDHRFAGPAVSQNFNAMISDSAMSTAITALNAQIISLADPLMADEAGLVEGYSSSTALAANQGGLPAGVKIPVHYTSRIAGGTSYIFAQVIRDGSTTATFHVPSLASATLTVIGESRTVNINSSGDFTDSFAADYTYHLYSTATAPSFIAPANLVAPAITDDGTPQDGETITVSTGTWTGAPTPTYTYQWQRNSGGGFANIVGGSSGSSFLLSSADVGATVRCRVTATNSQGSVTVSSNTISPAAAPTSGWVTAVTATSPVHWWRLTDYTDEVGSLDLTYNATGTIADTTSLVSDGVTTGAKSFDFSETAGLSVADDADLRLKTEWSFACWIKGQSGAITGSGNFVHNNTHYRIGTISSKVRVTLYTSSGNFWTQDSTATLTAGTTYFIAVVFDYATQKWKLYINGALDSTFSGTITTAPITGSGSSFSIGDDASSGAAGWWGDLDEFMIWHRVLSSTEVNDLYTAGI